MKRALTSALGVAAALAVIASGRTAVGAGDLPKFKAGLSTAFLGTPFYVVLTNLNMDDKFRRAKLEGEK